jgi:hypothetical protein
MRRVRNLLMALLIGCLAPVVIWVVGGAALYHSIKIKAAVNKRLQDMACSLDTDCPSGYICSNGYCVPE